MKVLVGSFNQEKALVGAFSVIVKTGCGTDGALHSTSQEPGCRMMGGAGPPYCCCLYFGVNLEIPARYCSSSLIDDLPCFDSESLDQNIRSVYI